MYECTSSNAQAAVNTLKQLSHLSGLALSIASCNGSELDFNFPDVDEWEGNVALPPLSGVPALTRLRLTGMVDLPPDFRQLSRLQQLAVFKCQAADGGHFAWGSEPLPGLASLTSVEIVPSYSAQGLPGAPNRQKSQCSNSCMCCCVSSAMC